MTSSSSSDRLSRSRRSEDAEPEAFPLMASTSLEHPRHQQRVASTSSQTLGPDLDPSSSSTASASPRKPVTRSKKAIAAVTGAVTTSLLMTPFDVIKTRLQTQATAEPLFVPSNHLPPAFSLRTASSSSSPANASARASQYSGIGAVGAHPATCCQQTFFTGNSQEHSLTCRYDPRQPSTSSSSPLTPRGNRSMRSAPRSSLSHSTSHTSSFSASTTPRSSVRILPSPPPAPNTYLHPTPMATIANGASSCACAFPDRKIAAKELEAAAAQQGRLTGLWDGVIKVARQEGIRSLWRGLTPTVVMSVPSQVMYMSCYDYFRSILLANEDVATVQAKYAQDSQSAEGVLPRAPSLSAITPHSLAASLVAGATARGISATLVTPLELIRTRQQAASGSSSSLSSILRNLFVEMRTSPDGPLILWRGLSPTLWRDVPFSAIYFAGYESTKRMLTGGGLGEGNAKGNGEEFGIAFFSGALSGSVAAVVTHPFDLVKTRLQVQHNDGNAAGQEGGARLSASLRARNASRSTLGVFGELRRIVEKEGARGLFRGLSPRTAKVAPACGVMIASFEVVGRLLSE